MRKTYKFDLEGNLVKTYASMKEACNDNNLNIGGLYLSIKNERRIRNFIYTHSEDYKGTLYTKKQGRPKELINGKFNIGQACEILGVSKFTIYNLISKGVLKATKIRGNWYIEEESLFSYIKER